MSDFDRLLEEELEKLKKKKKEEKQTVTPSKTLGNSLSYLPSYNRLTVADIAPVLRTTRMEEDDFAPIKTKADDSKLDFFQKGAFSDGYQFGDISKTILGTVGDVGLNVVKGIGGLGEGVGDLVSYGIAGVADLAGKDEWADSVRSRAQESLVDKVTKGADDYLNQYSLLGRTSDSIAQGVGQVGAILATGGIGAAAGFGTGGVTALTTGMMGLSGMGSGMGEAYKGGATDEEALAYGAISGAADALTEMLFGGLGKAVNAVGLSRGLSSADDMLAKKVSDLFKTQIAKNVAEFGIKAGAEGFEEVLAGIAQGIGKHITYADDKELSEIMKDENLLEQFIVGAVTSGIAQAPGLNIANKTKTDFVTGQTQQEQDVLKKVVEQRIAELEKEGKTLTNKQKGEIEADVLSDMEKGYISTETIEEVLGGDNYTAYQDTIKQENDALAELAELYEGEELQQKAEEFLNNSKRNEMAKTLSDSVYDMVKDTRLGESYRDRARRGQLFEADVTKYDEKQKVTIQRAIDSGVLNNANRTHDMVDFIAKVSADTGVLFDFTNNAKLKDSIFAVGGKTVDGYITKDGITINVNSPRYINTIVGHEITHAFEGSEQYEVLEKALFEYAKEKGNYKEVLKDAYDMYSGEEGYQGYEGLKKIKKEAVANLVGDYLFTDKNFVNHLSAKHQNIFQKVWNEVKYMVKIARAGSNEAKKLLEVQKAFEDAYRNGGKTPSEAKYDISVLDDGKVYVSASRKVINGNTKAEQRKEITEFFSDLLDGKPSLDIPTIEGDVLTITKKDTASKARDDFKTVNGQQIPMTDAEFTVKMHIESHIDEVAEVSKPMSGKKDNKNHPFAKDGFTYRRAYFEDFDGQYYEVTLSIGHNGTVATVYNVGKIEGSVPPSAKLIAVVGSKPLGRSLPKGDISQNDKKVNGQLSLSESKKLNDVGLEYDTKSETVTYSLSSLEDAFDYNKSEADYLASRLEYETALAKSIAVDKENVTEEEMDKAKRYLDSLFLIHDMIAMDRDRLDYEAAVGKSAWVSNAEYGGSIDFSTLCAKRRLFTGTFDAIQNELPDTVLDENDFLQIRNMLLEKELESPCSMCYVEGSRAKHGVYVAKFLKEYKQTNPEWIPQIADFTSTTRLEQTRINHPEAYEAYVEAMNKLSQRKPKEASVRTDYRGEILRDFKDTSTVAEKNKNGGVRFNSFSDFEIIHAIDCMQVLTDMARVGLNGQAYTKVKEFAEAFGNTGLKINLSLVAKDVDENGKLIMDETNGMKYDEALDLRNRYSENVGTVIVVFNEEQLRAALADSTIDYVLPFHRSQWRKSQYTMMGLPVSTKDFTNYQNDRIKNPNTGRDVKLSKIKHISEYTNDITGETFEIKDNIMPNQYWDFNLDGRGNAQRYLDYINANGMTPKFNFLLDKVDGKWVLPEGAVGDGYFKVLIDFKMYDNDGWGSPQNPVVPEFNMPFIQQMLENYKGGHQAFPVAHDVVSEFVEGKKSGKFSLSNDETHPIKQGNWHISGKDIAYEDIAPVGENVSPTVSKTETTTEELFPDDLGSAQYETESFDSIDDADAPPEMDTAHDEFADTTPLNKKTVTDLSKKVKNLLGIKNNRTGEVVSMIEAYSRSEDRSTEKLFEELKDKFGKYTEKYVDEPTKELKALLRGYKINVSDSIKSEIADYADLMRRNFGRVRFSKEGMNVDEVYEDLHASYPGYFPKSIINPTDQLLRIIDVANLEAEDVVDMEVDDESLADAARTIAKTVRAYQQSQMQDLSNREGIEAFDSLMESADDIAPVGDIAPVVKQKEKTAGIEKPAVDPATKKDSFISQKAQELYNEIRNLRKGVKASESLGFLLDYGYEWRTIKTALLNIRDHPSKRVDQNSAIESIARKMLNEQYEDMEYELSELQAKIKEKPIKTVKERLTAKMQGLETELANNRKLREESWSDYDSEIARAQAEYNAKSNKNTVAANDLLRRIERLNRMKHNTDADYAKRISDLEARTAKVAEEVRTGQSASEQGAMRQELHNRILSNIRNRFEEKGFDFDNVLRNAKNLSTFATVDNTPQRVMEKALGYKQGQVLSDLTVNQVAQNETEGIKWLNTFTERKNGVLAKLSKQYHIKPGSKESAAAQMYAEGFYVNDKNEIVQYGDAELAQDFPNATVRQNIKGLARDPRIRQIYDGTLDKINESRSRNAYPEIQRLDNYFLHFRAMDDTFSKLGIPFNPNDIKAKDLPTDLNGVTADLKPGQPYFASAMHREGKRTSFDLLGGLERYLSSAKNQIYHIDDIQTLRALRNYVADTYGQAHGLESLDLLTEEEAQERIEKVYGSHLSTFAKFLNEEANVIAGKTALIDRGLEGIIGRRGITFLDTVNRQVGSNMVGFNISSSLTNFLPVAQTMAKTNKFDFLKAFAQTVSNKVGSVFGRGDSFTEDSPVFIRRKGEERFYRTPWQKAGDAGYMLMGAVDDISTELIARTKYNELTRKGMDSKQAHYETDKWVSRLMGDRSLGQQPQLYNSKMLGMITKFQLEVRNQLDAQFYDTIQEEKASNEHIQNGLLRNAKTAAKVGSTFFQLAVAQHLFGKAFESVAGYNPAFDIISVLIKAFGWDDDDESEDTVLDNIEEGFLELLGDLPYTSTLTGGRIPISSALPVQQFVTGKDQYGNETSRWETLASAAPYYVLPGGYGQAKKTYQGLSMFDDDLPVSGSYTDSGNLRFPVEDTIGNRVQAGLFGQYASQNARDYFDNERSPLKPNQIQEYIDVDLPIADYWKYREGLSEHPTLDAKGDYIGGLDLPISKKNILINNIAKREEPINMADYAKYPNFHEFDWAEQNEEKYAFLQEHGMSYSDYEKLDEDSKKAYTWAYNNPEKYDFVKKQGLSATEYYSLDDDTKDAYGWAYDNPESYTVSKAVSNDFLTYYQYKTDLSKLNAKNENGESVSGLKKERVIDYINGLDIEYGQKIILFRSMYDSKADKAEYNADIVDYLNSRDDLSYEEIVTILKKLGFTVTDDGTVKW